jgi:hypothetical protein
MILFQKQKECFDSKYIQIFAISLQVNICAKVSHSPNIPLTIEVGLGLITISYEVWKILK